MVSSHVDAYCYVLSDGQATALKEAIVTAVPSAGPLYEVGAVAVVSSSPQVLPRKDGCLSCDDEVMMLSPPPHRTH